MLTGFGIRGFRSFGPDPQFFAPLGRINILAGQNNAGKSNVLRAIVGLAEFVSGKNTRPNPALKIFSLTRESQHISATPTPITIFLPFELSEAHAIAICEPLKSRDHNSYRNASQLLIHLLKNWPGRVTGGIAWFEYDPNKSEPLQSPSPSDFIGASGSPKTLAHHEWQQLWTALTGQSGGSITDHWLPQVITRLSPLAQAQLSKVYQIEAFRKIGDPGSEHDGLNGQGLIKRLSELERPTSTKLADKLVFEKINQFVRDVTGNPTARIEIPYDRRTIHLSIDSRDLPLESLGTGLHETIILAAAATTINRSIICMEEPEIHLHPTLQRRLLRYLGEQTDNQYFIATHSAHLLDVPDASVFHVRLDEGVTRVALATTPTTRAAICADLGYRASDLVQANCVIWVEGPSDRIYLTHWLSQVAPDLREGLDYSVMFYGGRLLSHLSADDPEIDDFISLRRLNRNIAIVIDSDRDRKRARMNATKRRVQEEFDKGPGFAWITKGREIENYIPVDTLTDAMTTLHPSASLISTRQFDHCYSFKNLPKQRVRKEVDKVKLAHQIVKLSPSLDSLDLRNQLRRMVSFIETSNHRLADRKSSAPLVLDPHSGAFV